MEPVVRQIVPSLNFNGGVAIGEVKELEVDISALAIALGITTLVHACLTADGKLGLQGVI